MDSANTIVTLRLKIWEGILELFQLYVPSKFRGNVQSSLLRNYKEVPITVVHRPVGHGHVTREHVYSNTVPGLAVPGT